MRSPTPQTTDLLVVMDRVWFQAVTRDVAGWTEILKCSDLPEKRGKPITRRVVPGFLDHRSESYAWRHGVLPLATHHQGGAARLEPDRQLDRQIA
jgi:hypothetical protein